MSGRTKVFAGLLAALSFVALCVTVYLAWSSWQTEAVAGCGANGVVDCDQVLSSPWSRWLGIPVSLFGALIYAIILAICWPAAKHPWGLAGSGLLFLSLSAAGAGIWFIAIQGFLLQSFCLYCLTVHSCGLLIAGITLLLIQGGEQEADYDQMRGLLGVGESAMTLEPSGRLPSEGRFYPLIATGAAAVGLAILMGGQIFFTPKSMVVESLAESDSYLEEQEEAEDLAFKSVAENDEGHETLLRVDDAKLFTESVDATSRRMFFKGLQKSINLSEYPLIGSPDALHVYVELLDYTCRHCRHLHPYIEMTLEQYGDQFAFLIYHVPLNSRCNPHVLKDDPSKKNACDYVQLAIGVWKLAPDRFLEFHNWLMEGEKPPSILEASMRAVSIAGEDVLVDKSLQNETSQRISQQCDVLNRLKTGLPVLLTEQGTMIQGIPENEQEWAEFIEGKLGKGMTNDAQLIEKGPTDE